jgi:hypothetical protein
MMRRTIGMGKDRHATAGAGGKDNGFEYGLNGLTATREVHRRQDRSQVQDAVAPNRKMRGDGR